MVTTEREPLERLLERRLRAQPRPSSPNSCPDADPRTRPPVVAIPMAHDPELLRCVGDAMQSGVAAFVLVGREAEVRKLADTIGMSIEGIRFVHCDDEPAACRAAAELAASGEVQLLMKGHVQTATFIRAILDSRNGLIEEGRIISHTALLDIPAYHKLLFLSDAAINATPDLERKIAIMTNAIDTAHSIGVRLPKVACVAPSETPTPQIQSTIDAGLIRDRFLGGGLPIDSREAVIDGPFAFDVAISREAARIKGIESTVAGEADILLMPNLDAANALYKCLVAFAGAHVAGIVAGARVPIVLTSRSDNRFDRYRSLLLALAAADAATGVRS